MGVVTVYYQDDTVTLYAGDCVEVLATMDDSSIDAVITDPPYGLEFMGKDWDRPWAVSPTSSVGYEGRTGNLTLPSHRDNRNANCQACGGRQRGAKRCSCDAPQWDRAPSSDMREFQQWCESWARECLRVLKPGGHIAAFGGTRTFHRLAAGIEDAGFEVRDSLAWLYGSGFPKSLDVSKAIDRAAGAEREVVGRRTDRAATPRTDMRGGNYGSGTSKPAAIDLSAITAPATDAAQQWEGWGTALKPAFEPIILARKPFSGTVAANCVEHGTGALNIDGCRVASIDGQLAEKYASVQNAPPRANVIYGQDNRSREGSEPHSLGRFPANVLLDESSADEIDKQSGHQRDGIAVQRNGGGQRIFNQGDGITRGDEGYGGEGGASRFFPVFKYTAKAPGSERPNVNGVAHPTVKPLDLMRWLVRLLTPPGGLVLDPFGGSGTTAEACVHEYMRCITIEREPDYLPLIVARLSKPMAVGFDFGSAS